MATTNKLSWLKKIYWRHFAKPQEDRELHRLLVDRTFDSVLEIGMGDGERTRRVLQLCRTTTAETKLRYVGLDLFEGSSADRPHLKLIAAHRLFAECGLKANLIPGETCASLIRVSHNVQPCQLVIVGEGWVKGGIEDEAYSRWIPRLVTPEGVVVAATSVGGPLQQIPLRSELAVKIAA